MEERIGQYRLIQVLGHGSFGEVYLGEHVHKQTLAAVKVLDNGCCLWLSSREGVHT
jgi:serine/threonine protein kinase